MSSPRSTAKGSFPTKLFAQSTAWPRPFGIFCLTYCMFTISDMDLTSSRRSYFSFDSSSSSSSMDLSKWSSMARLFLPVIMSMSVMPLFTASSMMYWIVGLSTIGSISLGCALVAGRNLVPSPAAGITALVIFISISFRLSGGHLCLLRRYGLCGAIRSLFLSCILCLWEPS